MASARAFQTASSFSDGWGSTPPSLSTIFAGANRQDEPVEAFTGATDPAFVHETGWSAKVRLDQEGRDGLGMDGAWRSGEVVRGAVEVVPPAVLTPTTPRPISIKVRLFWQSTSYYHHNKIVAVGPPPSGILKRFQPAGMNLRAIPEVRADWCRGFVGSEEGVEIWEAEGVREWQRISNEVEESFPLLRDDGAAPPRQLPTPPAERDDPMEELRACDATTTKSLPFAFSLPTLTATTATSARTTTPFLRTLLNHPRPPPPSFASNPTAISSTANPTATCEWLIEVLVRFSPPTASAGDETLPPAFTTTPTTPLSFMSHHLPSSLLLPIRHTLPFTPHDSHIQPLYTHWRPSLTNHWSSLLAQHSGMSIEEMEDPNPVDIPDEAITPSFGKDPRDEALGGVHVGPRRELAGTLVQTEGGREKWATWEKRIQIRGRLGKGVKGWVRCQISSPRSSIVPRHSLHLPLLLHLSYPLNQPSSSTSIPSATTPKHKPVVIDKIVVLISRRTLTRGGREERPRFGLEEVRRSEIYLSEGMGGGAGSGGAGMEEVVRTITTNSGVSIPEDGAPVERKSSGSNGGLLLYPTCQTPGVEMKLLLDLQSEGVTRSGKKLTPLKECVLNFRTPNIEVEYILSVTIHPVGMSSFFILRTPIQLVAGDDDAVPDFAEGSGAPPAPAVAAPVQIQIPPQGDGLPSYGA